MVQVFQKNPTFHPTELILKPGDSVRWTHRKEDGTTHSVVQGNRSDIDSPDIEPEQTFAWTIDKPGQWDMICRYHPAVYMTVGVLGKDGKVPRRAIRPGAAPPVPFQRGTTVAQDASSIVPDVPDLSTP
jgi:hypothetical protein